MVRELWEVVVDAVRSADLGGHLRAWWLVVTRRVSADSSAEVVLG